MMSDVHVILCENLPYECESFEDAIAKCYDPEYGRNKQGELYAKWVKLDIKNLEKKKEEILLSIAHLEYSVDRDNAHIVELKNKLKEINNKIEQLKGEKIK